MICIFSPGYVLPRRGQASDGVWLEVGGTQGVCSVCAEGRSVALGTEVPGPGVSKWVSVGTRNENGKELLRSLAGRQLRFLQMVFLDCLVLM